MIPENTAALSYGLLAGWGIFFSLLKSVVFVLLILCMIKYLKEKK